MVLQELRREHGEIIRLVRALWTQVRELESGVSENYELMERILAYLTEIPDRFHHPCEEHLFDALQQRTSALDDVVARLREQHEELMEHGTRLRDRLGAAAAGQPTLKADIVGACHDYIMAQRWHMYDEEFSVFPTAQSQLTSGQWRQLEEHSRKLRKGEEQVRSTFTELIAESKSDRPPGHSTHPSQRTA